MGVLSHTPLPVTVLPTSSQHHLHQAPCEAEAQCAELVKSGMVYATATEDMDALTFGSSVLLRHMTFSEARKMPIQEFYLDKVLTDLELTMDQVLLLNSGGN